MDPLDPLTEIINSGQAFSLAIATERFIWLIIGVFLIAAILKSITNSIQNQESIRIKSFFQYFITHKHKDNGSK